MFSNRLLPQAVAFLARNFTRLTLTEPSRQSIPALTKVLQPNKSENLLTFRSRENATLDITHRHRNPLIPAKEIIDLPLISRIIETPSRLPTAAEIGDVAVPVPAVELPTDVGRNVDGGGIQAARLIVIRRRKMRKHKLKKLRKRLKFERAKVRQRRELRKEKAFQAELIGQIAEAEKFSAEQYVTEKLRRATETPIPRFWKGKRLPQFIIKQKLGLK